MSTFHLDDSTYLSLTDRLAELAEGERPNLLDVQSEVRLALAEAGIFSTYNRNATECANFIESVLECHGEERVVCSSESAI